MPPVHLLADVMSWLLPAAVIVFYVIVHLWSSAAQQQRKQQHPQQQRRPQPGERQFPPQAAKGAAQQPDNQAQLNAEIEEFLKRAQQRKQDKTRRETAPRPAPPSPPLVERPIEAAPVGERRGFDSVAASVSEHIGDRGFSERAEQLAGDLKRSKEEFEMRVGSLGTLSEPSAQLESTRAAAERPPAAAAIAGLFSDPENLRKAVLLKEILERPIDRW